MLLKVLEILNSTQVIRLYSEESFSAHVVLHMSSLRKKFDNIVSFHVE